MPAPIHPYLALILLGFLCFFAVIIVCCYLWGSDDADRGSERKEDEKHVHFMDSLVDRSKARETALRRCITLTESCLVGAVCEERTPGMFNQIEVRSGKLRRLESMLWVWCAAADITPESVKNTERVVRAAAYVLSVMADNKPTVMEAEALVRLRRKMYSEGGAESRNLFEELAAPFGLSRSYESTLLCPWAERVRKSYEVRQLMKAALELVSPEETEEPDFYFARCARCRRAFPVTKLQDLLCPECHR